MKTKAWEWLVKPSTAAFFREGKTAPRTTFWDRAHGYVYARWTYFYIGVGTGEHRLTRVMRPLFNAVSSLLGLNRGATEAEKRAAFADSYHGKVLPLAEAECLVSLDEDLTARDLEKVIPYARARDIVLKNPDHLAVLDCPCRAARPDPCRPLDVCLVVGEPFASFVTEHHPGRSRRVTREEAVEILRAEHARGHVAHAFFKDAMLDRFYAICNCCSCCCGALQAHRTGTPMLAASGFSVRIDGVKCLACGACVESCPFGALGLEAGSLSVDTGKCMGCGVCADKCPEGALALVRDASKGEPLEIRVLAAGA